MSRAKVRRPGRSEREVSEQCIAAAALYGIILKRRNVGAALNPAGRLVTFGEAGDSDYYAIIQCGIHMSLEIKREAFDPERVRGEERARFRRQLEKLRQVNAAGGVGLWVRDSLDLARALGRIIEGWRVDIDDRGYCWLTSPDEKRGGHR